MKKPLAEVLLSCGRQYLSVAGIAVAVEGDKCRTSSLPDDVYDPIPAEEMETATIGGKPIKDMEPSVIRFFRTDNWTPKMLEFVAEKINQAAQSGE
jgi:hypothetical protein